MNPCPICKNPMRPGRVRYVHEQNGHTTIIENLPALVCEKCGEQTYTPEALKVVITMIKRGHPPNNTANIVVYDASDVFSDVG